MDNHNVLKIGPDWPVRPVEPSIGYKTGSVQSKNRFCIEPDELVGSQGTDRFSHTIFFFQVKTMSF